MEQEPEQQPSSQMALSEIWRQLLGERPLDAEALRELIPTIESDPWSALLQAKGVEMVDLEQLHLHISDQDVERVLQLMQEQPASGQHDQPDASAKR
jgi:hypothetical protein